MSVRALVALGLVLVISLGLLGFQAYTDAQEAPNSESGLTLDPNVGPGAPQDLGLDDAETGTGLDAAWTAPASFVDSYEVALYLNEERSDGTTAALRERLETAAADAQTHTFADLVASTTYTVAVRAVNSTGPGPWSTATATTPADDG